jgi:hypothetical protein
MRKMGHVEGQGLGRTGDGIVHALAAEHVVEGGKGKKPDAKGKGWTQAPSAKGRLVNMNEQTRQREERAKYGEPSRIVCLVNVMGSVEEADQETMEVSSGCWLRRRVLTLLQDLGEKLKEHGWVFRGSDMKITDPLLALSSGSSRTLSTRHRRTRTKPCASSPSFPALQAHGRRSRISMGGSLEADRL